MAIYYGDGETDSVWRLANEEPGLVSTYCPLCGKAATYIEIDYKPGPLILSYRYGHPDTAACYVPVS